MGSAVQSVSGRSIEPTFRVFHTLFYLVRLRLRAHVWEDLGIGGSRHWVPSPAGLW